MDTISLKDAVQGAAILADDGSNVEYVRGMCELLAMCFPVEGMEPDQRAAWFEIMLRTANGDLQDVERIALELEGNPGLSRTDALRNAQEIVAQSRATAC